MSDCLKHASRGGAVFEITLAPQRDMQERKAYRVLGTRSLAPAAGLGVV